MRASRYRMVIGLPMIIVSLWMGCATAAWSYGPGRAIRHCEAWLAESLGITAAQRDTAVAVVTGAYLVRGSLDVRGERRQYTCRAERRPNGWAVGVSVQRPRSESKRSVATTPGGRERAAAVASPSRAGGAISLASVLLDFP